MSPGPRSLWNAHSFGAGVAAGREPGVGCESGPLSNPLSSPTMVPSGWDDTTVHEESPYQAPKHLTGPPSTRCALSGWLTQNRYSAPPALANQDDLRERACQSAWDCSRCFSARLPGFPDLSPRGSSGSAPSRRVDLSVWRSASKLRYHSWIAEAPHHSQQQQAAEATRYPSRAGRILRFSQATSRSS